MSLIDFGALREAMHFRETHQERLSRQLGQLRREVGTVSRQLAEMGGHRIDQAGQGLAHLAALALRQGGAVAGNASAAGRAIRNDPMPAIVLLATGALLWRLLAGRRA